MTGVSRHHGVRPPPAQDAANHHVLVRHHRRRRNRPVPDRQHHRRRSTTRAAPRSKRRCRPTAGPPPKPPSPAAPGRISSSPPARPSSLSWQSRPVAAAGRVRRRSTAGPTRSPLGARSRQGRRPALLAFPNEIETLVLYYNKTLFEENGWTAPTTMDELMTLAADDRDAGHHPVRPRQRRVAADQRVVRRRVPEPRRRSGQGLPGADRRGAVDRSRLRRCPDHAQPHAAERLVHGRTRPLLHHPDRPTPPPRFAYGDAAMKIEGTWFVSDAMTFFAEVGQEWDWAPVPSTTATRSSTSASAPPTRSTRTPSTRRSRRGVPDLLLLARNPGDAVAECGMAPGTGRHPDRSPRPISIERQAGMIDALTNASQQPATTATPPGPSSRRRPRPYIYRGDREGLGRRHDRRGIPPGHAGHVRRPRLRSR